MSNEKITFDLQGSPPSEVVLQSMGSAVRKEDKDLLRGLVFLFVLLAVDVAALVITFKSGTGFIFLPFMASSLLLAVLFSRHGTRESEVKDKSRMLEPVTPESDPQAYLQIDALIEYDPVIRRYFRAVAAQGRLPVRGEINAAMAWVADAEHRQLQAKAQAAWQSRYEQ